MMSKKAQKWFVINIIILIIVNMTSAWLCVGIDTLLIHEVINLLGKGIVIIITTIINIFIVFWFLLYWWSDNTWNNIKRKFKR